MSTVQDWYRGDPAALDLGVQALRRRRAFRDDAPDDIRIAVARLQKRWGHPPTGTLSRAEWDRLVTRKASPTAVDDASRAATNDASPPGQDDESEPASEQPE